MTASPAGSATFLGEHFINSIVCQNGLDSCFAEPGYLPAFWCQKIVCRKRRRLTACLACYDEDNAERAFALNLFMRSEIREA